VARASSHCCGVVDLAHEEHALGRVLQDEDHEGSVQFHGLRHAHGHDLNGGDPRRHCSCLIHTQQGLVGHLWGNREDTVRVLENCSSQKESLWDRLSSMYLCAR